MTELQREDLIIKYPGLEDEITSLLEWWRKEEKMFEVPYSDTRVDAETQRATYGDVYNRLCWQKSSVTTETDEEMKSHNKKLLELLKDQFGWKEPDERFYPDPNSIA